MACNHVDFVTFDLSREDHRRLSRHDPLPQLSGHVMSAVFIQPQLTSDLPIRQIQTHEVQAQQPDAQRLMMPRENGVGEIIKVPPATATQVALPIRLSLVQAPLRHPLRLAMRATHPPPANAASEPSQSTSHRQSTAEEQVPSLAPRYKSPRLFTPLPVVCSPDDLTAFPPHEQTSPKLRMSPGELRGARKNDKKFERGMLSPN